jgi:hypothetical protein
MPGQPSSFMSDPPEKYNFKHISKEWNALFRHSTLVNTCFSPVRSPAKDGCTMSHNKGVSAKNYSEDSKEAHEAYAGSI